VARAEQIEDDTPRCGSFNDHRRCQREKGHGGWHAYVEGYRMCSSWAPYTERVEGDPMVLASEALVFAAHSDWSSRG
jgi:hypothetical protein